MIKIRKPKSLSPFDGKVTYEDFVIYYPRQKPVSGSELTDYEELIDIPGDRVVYRVRGNPWYEGLTSEWKVEVFDTGSHKFLEQELYRVDKVGRMWDLYVTLSKTADPPYSADPLTMSLGGEPMTLGGEDMRI